MFKNTVINLSDTELLGSPELLQGGHEGHKIPFDIEQPPGKQMCLTQENEELTSALILVL